MDLFKVKRFRKAHKPNPEKDSEDKPVPPPEEMKNENENGNDLTKSGKADPVSETEDDDDDDFITNEVKRRLKELRRNSCMVLIPEESCPEEEEGETSSSECRESEVDTHCPWSGFDSVYDKYCERMLFFDRMIAQQLQESNKLCSQIPSSPSPRSASKKLASTLRSLSFKKREEPQDESENLQQQQQHDDPYQDLETAYVAQICLSWEALHCQYTKLSHLSPETEHLTCYSNAAQQFQQFQVLLHRFIENEPFEQGHRVEIYARTKNSLPKLLQVPNIQGSALNQKDEKEEQLDFPVLASDLIKIIEDSILIFRLFLKMDKKKSSGVLNIFGGQNQIATPLQQVESTLQKKEMKLKELYKKKVGKRKSWPKKHHEVELLFSLVDVKVISRVLRMVRISKEQLLWCEEKLSKLDLVQGKLQRDPSPVLFAC